MEEEINNIPEEETPKKKAMKIGIIGNGGLFGGRSAFSQKLIESVEKETGVPIGICSTPHLETEIPEIVARLALQMKDKSGPIIVAGGGGEKSYKIENGEVSIFDGKIATDKDGQKVVLDNSNVDKIPLSFLKDNTFPFTKRPELPSMDVFDNTPNKLSLIRNLNLSPEQIDYFMFAPPQRLEGESQDDYKRRRMLNKILIKYKGEY